MQIYGSISKHLLIMLFQISLKLKVIGNTPSVIKTQKLEANIRIKQELKFLYKKKSNLNIQLYSEHLHTAAYWGKRIISMKV
jgi:hypothetical protein